MKNAFSLLSAAIQSQKAYLTAGLVLLYYNFIRTLKGYAVFHRLKQSVPLLETVVSSARN
jgi:hypothetical protein